MEKESRRKARIRKVWWTISPSWFNEVFEHQSMVGKRISEAIRPLLPQIKFPPVSLVKAANELTHNASRLNLLNRLDTEAVMDIVITGDSDSDRERALRSDQEQLETLVLFTRKFGLCRIEGQLIVGFIITNQEERLHPREEADVFLKNGLFPHCAWGKEYHRLTGEKLPWVMVPMYAPPKDIKDYYVFYDRATDLFDAFLRADDWDFRKLKAQIEQLRAKYIPREQAIPAA